MNKQILKLAIPSILANITIPLVGLVDTAIVGHVADATAIGGIAIGTMLFDLMYWNFGFLRVSTSGLTAQSLGRQRLDECAMWLMRSLRIALIGAIALLAVQWLFVKMALMLVPCSVEVATFAQKYFFIRIWAAPATLALMAAKGWFIGMQDTVSTMIVDIMVNCINMLASYLLAVQTSLGPIGVAHGTVIAQYAGLLTAGILAFARHKKALKAYNPSTTSGISLFKLNTNLFIRSLCFMIIYVGFTAIAGKYGDIELAVSSIIMKLMMVFSFFVDGFAFAGEALVGKAIGAGQQTRPIVRLLFIWCLGVGAAATLFYALTADACVALITDDLSVQSAARAYYIWLIGMPLISTLAFMWDGIYTGAAAGVQIRNAMIWAALGFVVVYAVLNRQYGMHALYLAYFTHLLARTIYLTMKWNYNR